ncbi:FKBP-type peptidyl-prolyl cis-trans isomerase [Candidatus Gracilibacteria bacterium]|nr:FKBP-type peptidyl-prolyl cis-trans isomerase [Candidatus Gracilibacteria bacterium]
MKKIGLLMIVLASIFIFGCGKTQILESIEIGDKVKISYDSKFENGDIFEENQTKEIIVGNQEIIEGLENAIIGMKQGEVKEVLVNPNVGYGDKYDDKNIQQLAKFIFDRLNLVPEMGKEYQIGDINGIVKGIQGDGDYTIVLLDTNPKETYQNLIFNVKIDEISE